jgi:hypothetical protein
MDIKVFSKKLKKNKFRRVRKNKNKLTINEILELPIFFL